MPPITRLTNNSDETDIATLISKDNIFSIPFFQRPYKWNKSRVDKILEDILSLVDESSDFHFLGAVIVHGRRTNPSDPDIFDVIDGQQRLTSIFLILCAIVKIFCEKGEHQDASGVFLKYIAINRSLAHLSNSRLHSCKEDRAQLNYVIQELLSDPKLENHMPGFKFRKIPVVANTSEKGRLRTNYNIIKRFLKYEYEEGGIDRIRDIYDCLLNKVTIVQIDIKDPASGPAIFDSLNSRQEPMTIGDLVRNGIFARVANLDPDEIDDIDQDVWQPFYKDFENDGRNYFDSFFFPYGLTQDANLRKTDTYNFLQQKWSSENDPKKIIDELKVFQDPFMDLTCGTNRMGHPKSLAEGFLQLNKLGAPSSTLPFLMLLSAEIGQGTISEKDSTEVLAVVESFLVRRAVCGIEPTGLHAVFKRLWNDVKAEVTAVNVTKKISDHKTVTWPSDAEFMNALKTRALYGTAITPYLLAEYDVSLGGDVPKNIPWIEHILPRTPHKDWWDKFSKEDHELYKDTIANLIPLSSEMNRALSNGVYLKKRSKILEGSMYKSARKTVEDYEDWDLEAIKDRSSEIASWAVGRWSQGRA